MSLSLSKNSFLYRMTAKPWEFFDIEPSQSLCVFFWQMVLAPFMILVGAGIALLVIIALTWFFTYAVGGLVITMLHSFLPDSWILPKGEFNWRYIVASLLIWLTVVGGVSLRIYTNYRRDVKIEEGTYKPSVTIEFIKAKKRKICPLIEFE